MLRYMPGVAKPALCMIRIYQIPSYKEPQHRNQKTRIYLQSTLLWHTSFGTTCKSNVVQRASYHSTILQDFYTLQ